MNSGAYSKKVACTVQEFFVFTGIGAIEAKCVIKARTRYTAKEKCTKLEK